MVQEIDFKGLSFSPSDHECQDGDLGCMVNLLNEDGALKAITLRGGEVVGEIPSACNIVTVHKNSGYCHWVLDCVEDEVHTWKWTDKNGTGGDDFDLPSGFEPKSVTTMGNMVCFVGETETVYALWKDGAYVVFSLKDLDYTVEIREQSSHSTSESVYLGGDFIGHFNGVPLNNNTHNDLDGFPEQVSSVRVTKEGSMNLFSAIDAKLTEVAEGSGEDYLRYVTLGVAAVRLYDGTLLNVSDIFVLGDHQNNRPLRVDRQSMTIGGNGILDWGSYQSWELTANMAKLSDDTLKDIVTGISIYITIGDPYLELDKVYQLTLTTGNSGNFEGSFTWEAKRGKSLCDAIDAESFFLTKTIEKDDLDTPITLKRVTGAEEAMTLSDFRRSSLGAEYSYVYNHRLHLASVMEEKAGPFMPKIHIKWLGSAFGTAPDHRYIPDAEWLLMNTIAEVKGTFNGESRTMWFKADDVSYPRCPIVMVPITEATEMTLYMSLRQYANNNIYAYYKKTMHLHQSTSLGCSYYIYEGEGQIGMQLFQSKVITLGGTTIHPDWVEIDSTEYNNALTQYYQSDNTVERESLIKVSEVNNPLVFPVGNTVQVGAGKILGLATNTEPISEGQFGVAPLYAFTDEGVWPLSVSNTGTYSSLGQPSSRDVVTDAKSITPIDKGVLFATKRGVMIIRGNQVECLTESLNGIPWDSTCLPHHQEIMGGMDPVVVDYQRLEDFLPDSRMLYDYARQRVYIYHEEHDYALVLSLRTGLWGAVEKGRLQGGVPWYPETYVLREDNNVKEIVDLSAPSDLTEKIGVMCCSRPLSLEARNVHKSVMHAVVRGLAHLRGSGEESRLGCALYGSNDLYHWQAVNSSTNQYLRGRYGQPWKWWRIAIVGEMDEAETIDGVTMDVKVRLNNRLR